MTDTLRRMARAICCGAGPCEPMRPGGACQAVATFSGDARAALLVVRPLDPEVERAVALAGCSKTWDCAAAARCWGNASSKEPTSDCLTRARRTVDALIEAILGEKVT